MRAVADRLFVAVLAATEENALVRFSCVLDRRNACVFVTAITKGLLAALAARTPEVAFAFLDLDGVGGFLCDDGRSHVKASPVLEQDIGWFCKT